MDNEQDIDWPSFKDTLLDNHFQSTDKLDKLLNNIRDNVKYQLGKIMRIKKYQEQAQSIREIVKERINEKKLYIPVYIN